MNRVSVRTRSAAELATGCRRGAAQGKPPLHGLITDLRVQISSEPARTTNIERWRSSSAGRAIRRSSDAGAAGGSRDVVATHRRRDNRGQGSRRVVRNSPTPLTTRSGAVCLIGYPGAPQIALKGYRTDGHAVVCEQGGDVAPRVALGSHCTQIWCWQRDHFLLADGLIAIWWKRLERSRDVV